METILSLVLHYKYYGVYCFFLAGCFGPPVPDEIILMAIGYVAFWEILEFTPSWWVAMVGSFSGISLNYVVGRFFFTALERLRGNNRRGQPKIIAAIQERVKRQGPVIILVSYFVPGCRHWVPVIAGMLKMPPATFGLWAGTGAFLWSTTYLTLGYWLAWSGLTFSSVESPGLHLAVPGAVAALLPAFWARKKLFSSS